jgi:hypothetical protein
MRPTPTPRTPRNPIIYLKLACMAICSVTNACRSSCDGLLGALARASGERKALIGPLDASAPFQIYPYSPHAKPNINESNANIFKSRSIKHPFRPCTHLSVDGWGGEGGSTLNNSHQNHAVLCSIAHSQIHSLEHLYNIFKQHTTPIITPRFLITEASEAFALVLHA